MVNSRCIDYYTMKMKLNKIFLLGYNLKLSKLVIWFLLRPSKISSWYVHIFSIRPFFEISSFNSLNSASDIIGKIAATGWNLMCYPRWMFLYGWLNWDAIFLISACIPDSQLYSLFLQVMPLCPRWPLQNPPPVAGSKSPTWGEILPPQRQGKMSLPILDWKIHTFFLFHPERFRFRSINRTDVSLSRWLLPPNWSRWQDHYWVLMPEWFGAHSCPDKRLFPYSQSACAIGLPLIRLSCCTGHIAIIHMRIALLLLFRRAPTWIYLGLHQVKAISWA